MARQMELEWAPARRSGSLPKTALDFESWDVATQQTGGEELKGEREVPQWPFPSTRFPYSSETVDDACHSRTGPSRDTYHPLKGRRNEATVHRDKSAANIGLKNKTQGRRQGSALSYSHTPQHSFSSAYLDKLILGAKVRYDDILSIRNASQGDAQASAGTRMAISRQGLQ